MAYEKETRTALELASKAGLVIKQYYVEGIEHRMKENNTPVTEADLASNRILLDGLVSKFPMDGIVSEEVDAIKGQNQRVWYLDPLDGTKSFVQRADTFGIHIGLAEDGVPTFGVVHKPLTGESYLGIKGVGAYRVLPDGRRKEISLRGGLDGLVGVVEKKRSDYENNRLIFERLGVTGCLFSGSEGLRVMKLLDNLAHFRIGSKAANAWDTCAPQAILEAAGGVAGYAFMDKPVTYKPGLKSDGTILYARDQKTFDLVKKAMREYSA